MKKILIIFIVLLCISPCFAGYYKVLRVVDGDTIDIAYKGKKERIRMLCVDTPESVHPDSSRNTPMGEKASDYTKHRLSGKYIGLEFQDRRRGRYGRLLAYVFIEGKNYNLELVRRGLSKYYTKYGISEKHHSDFLEAESSAKIANLNIWSVDTDRRPNMVKASIFHGNIKSRKFHFSSCRHHNCKSCIKVFQTRMDAVNAGYSPCGLCRP